MFSQLFWHRDRTSFDVMREYAAAECGHEVAEDIAESTGIMEKNHARHPGENAKGRRVIDLDGEGARAQVCHERLIHVCGAEKDPKDEKDVKD